MALRLAVRHYGLVPDTASKPHAPSDTGIRRWFIDVDFWVKSGIVKVGFVMPVLSLFYGIIVRMYKEVTGKHHKPHIHAEYARDEVVISLDGETLEGSIQANKLKLVEAWMEIHRDDLEANWKLLSKGEQCFRIEPLK